MRWLRKHSFIYYPQISLLRNSLASFSSHNHSIEDHHHYSYRFLSLLNNFPSSRCVTQQIHSQLTTNGSLNQFSNTQIIILFNTLLRRYAIGEFPQEALSLYKQAQKSTALYLNFDSFTYSFLIKACANLNQRSTGFQLNALVLQLGFERDVYVQTALLNMYIDFGSFINANKVFDEMPERHLVTWNVMLTGLVKWGHLEKALALFKNMPRKNIVSWTGMIDGFARMKNYLGAFSLFQEMMMVEGIMPTEATLLAISTAIAELGDLKNWQTLHAFGEKCGFIVNGSQVTHCFIDTYAKCGCIQSALKIFEKIFPSRRNVVSWTSIISGFAMHGMAKEAEEFLERMERSGIRPNRVTFLGILNAYSHSGLVEDGLRFFRKMVDHGFVAPDVKHYGSVIDMLGRAGKLKEAEEIACEIPNDIDNIIIWRTLLGACNFHGDVAIAERISMKMQDMEREYGGDYVLMSNILAGQGKFNEAENVRSLMDKRQVLKSPGHSSV
ncbi:hypothetical protein SOVF_184770 [Spinacia oleracea]|uniref:Pentatricopeptide repeat-containing protein At1g09220, mitochondrial n=1 Tax=Spinacia oleracea TaxID=3562 RepID=A0A9R0HVX1_SPIOL|nr:pentatricopeptide repeat-containing protein At1g09220, mitochondrial [Spinacia oleracea]KNA06035.1 hypothetical protein SOVF_184770 [Spinacia oleracea]